VRYSEKGARVRRMDLGGYEVVSVQIRLQNG